MPLKRQLTTGKRRRPRDTPPLIVLDIQNRALKGQTALDIHKALPEGTASLRTIYRIIEDKWPPDPTGAWAPLRSPEPSPSLVLPVLACLVETTNGSRASLTNAEAARIEALREAVPDLPLLQTYILAQAYVASESRKMDSEPLDMLLAFAPWRSIEHTERYFAALNRDWVQAPDAYTLQIAALAIPADASGGLATRFIDENKTPETWTYYQRFFFAPQEVGKA